MPLVKIEIRKGKSEEYKKSLLEGVHWALVQALKIPDSDRKQRLYELDADNFENNTDNAALIEITMFKGRSFAAKKELYGGYNKYPFQKSWYQRRRYYDSAELAAT